MLKISEKEKINEKSKNTGKHNGLFCDKLH